MSDHYANSEMNIEFESGSMASLLRITKTRKGLTVIPYLAALDLPNEEKKHIVEFEYPVPVRQVGMITNRFFVKERLLTSLKEIIQRSVVPLIPNPDTHEVFVPH